MKAARNGVYQFCVKTDHTLGETSHTIRSSRSVGVARKNQLYRKTSSLTARKRLVRPSASGNASTQAAPRDADARPSARSAPFQYGPERSTSQNRWVSKLANTREPEPTSRHLQGSAASLRAS